MDHGVNLFKQIYDVMDNDNLGVQLGCYSIALMGLTAAVRRVRPFSRFKKSSDIPNRFLSERTQLDGIVDRVEGPLLMVKHKPLVFSLSPADGELPVKIASVDINENGKIWLQSVVTGNQIKFIPIGKESNYVNCEVILPKAITHKTRSNKYTKTKNLSIGGTLVSIDFAKISYQQDALLKHNNLRYFITLKQAELLALKRKLGFKYYINSMKLFFNGTIHKILLLVLYMRTKQIFSVKRN